jgi:hypothetical protein
MKLTEIQRQMLHDLSLCEDNESWAEFDPPFPRRTSESLVRRQLIEVKGGDTFRLTDTGRTALTT